MQDADGMPTGPGVDRTLVVAVAAVESKFVEEPWCVSSDQRLGNLAGASCSGAERTGRVGRAVQVEKAGAAVLLVVKLLAPLHRHLRTAKPAEPCPWKQATAGTLDLGLGMRSPRSRSHQMLLPIRMLR